MKAFLIPGYFVMSFFLLNCKKSDKHAAPVNCDGLITDTSGTNDNGKVYMPNAFTPNGDGLNDAIKPLVQNIASIVFTVYDEANNVVFTSSVVGQGWVTSSTPNSSIKYYYKIQAITASNHKIGKCGELYKLACYPAGVSRSYFYFEDQLTPGGFTGITNETIGNCP